MRHAYPTYRRRRDWRLPIFMAGLLVTALVWVAISPKILGSPGEASPVAAAATPTPVPSPTPTPTLGPLPVCTIGDVPAVHAEASDWARTLLDTDYTLGPSYVPPDLIPVSRAGIGGAGSVRSLVIDDLKALTLAARKAGVTLVVNSAYRIYADQSATFGQVTASQGTDVALAAAARPGHSEHQLGTAIDFGGGAQWLSENAWRYGFISSYPAGAARALTCYVPEAWHYRYFGRATAAAIHNSGLIPRQWLWIDAG
jgi:zinc D-Ala-D-Ala carboxypeptidase